MRKPSPINSNGNDNTAKIKSPELKDEVGFSYFDLGLLNEIEIELTANPTIKKSSKDMFFNLIYN